MDDSLVTNSFTLNAEYNLDIFCSGMYRSGSTWQYNIASSLIELFHHGMRFGTMVAADYGSIHQPSACTNNWRTFKWHEVPASMIEVIQAGRGIVLYSYRDIRDVAYSLCHKYSQSFDEIIIRDQFLNHVLENDRNVSELPIAVLQSYERITNEPFRCAQEIANALQINADDETIHNLVAANSIDQALKVTEQVTQHYRALGLELATPEHTCTHDPITLLHWNHIRSGTNKDWRSLVQPHHLDFFHEHCTAILLKYGYEQSQDWATTIRQQLAPATSPATTINRIRTQFHSLLNKLVRN